MFRKHGSRDPGRSEKNQPNMRERDMVKRGLNGKEMTG